MGHFQWEFYAKSATYAVILIHAGAFLETYLQPWSTGTMKQFRYAFNSYW